MNKFFILILIAFTFAGCATIFTGTTQSVVFSAPAGTRIYMDGIKIAEVPIGYDAVSVRLDKSINGSSMIARKDGYKDAYFYLKGRVNGVVFVNILLGPCLIIGGAVDMVTGAAVNYPNYVEIEMEPLHGVQPANDTSLDDLLRF